MSLEKMKGFAKIMKVSNKLTMTNMPSRFFANFKTFFANFESHAIIYGVFLRAIREIALYTARKSKKAHFHR
jgi:hypothetical protein